MNITLEFIIEEIENEFQKDAVDAWLVSYELIFKGKFEKTINKYIGMIVNSDTIKMIHDDLKNELNNTKKYQHYFKLLNFNVDIYAPSIIYVKIGFKN